MRLAGDKDSIEAVRELKTGGKDHIETLSKDQVKTAGRDHIEAANVDQIEAIETQRVKEASPSPFPNLMMGEESARAKEFRAVVELDCLDSSYLEFARHEVVLCWEMWQSCQFFSGFTQLRLFEPRHQGKNSGITEHAKRLQLVVLSLQINPSTLSPFFFTSTLLLCGPLATNLLLLLHLNPLGVLCPPHSERE